MKKVVVIGDVMVDKTIHGVVERISPEAPVPIVRQREVTRDPGGAGNVARQMMGYEWMNVRLIGLVGDDEGGMYLRQAFSPSEACFLEGDRQTTVKLRIVDGGRQLLRIDSEDCSSVTGPLYGELMDTISEEIEDADAVILSDYGKGVVGAGVLDLVSQWSERTGGLMFLDPYPGNPAYHETFDFGKMGHLTVKPNAVEYAQLRYHFFYTTANNGDLKDLWPAADWLVTRGENGINLQGHEIDTVAHGIEVPVVDVCGAGDVVMAFYVMARLEGWNRHGSLAYANAAGALAVSRLGTARVERDEVEELAADAEAVRVSRHAVGMDCE